MEGRDERIRHHKRTPSEFGIAMLLGPRWDFAALVSYYTAWWYLVLLRGAQDDASLATSLT